MVFWITAIAVVVLGVLVLVAAAINAYGRFKTFKDVLDVTKTRVEDVQKKVEQLPLPSS